MNGLMDVYREKLKGLLGNMPISRIVRGEGGEWLRELGEAARKENARASQEIANYKAGRPSTMFNAAHTDPNLEGLAMDWGMNPMMGVSGLLGKIVYHGSPHKFDRFDASKIGTGEGAQAYGHGVYLADSQGVANGYAQTLGRGNVELGGVPLRSVREFKLPPNARGESQVITPTREVRDLASKFIEESGGDVEKAAALARRQPARTAADIEAIVRHPEVKIIPPSLYKADLPDEWIPKMLDWDKPLSQQPENVRLMAQDFGLSGDATGKDIYYALSNQARDIGIIKGQPLQTTLPGSQEKATADLLGFGVPGIRYMDGGSRMTPTQEESIKKALERAMARGDEGVANSLRAQLENRTSNYVVFPGMEDKVKILERNGIPLQGLLSP